MENIKVCLLGTPTVTINDEQVYFPYKKSEGLFYYMCVNKSATREELISILWSEYDEAKAKKNLRDAIYKIKKLLGEEIFTIIGKSTIQLNTNLRLDIDTDMITDSNILSLYTSDFLSNFFIKDCYEFEEWTSAKKQFYKDMYLGAVKSKLHEMVNIGDIKRINYYSDILLKNDPYNEKVYRDIMRIYALGGNYNMSVKIYHDLCKLLKDELDVEPELSTQNILSQILKLKEESAENNKTEYFYGRFQEIYAINNYITSFKSDMSTSIILKGEAGIGKSALISKIIDGIDTKKYVIFKAICFKDEMQFFLKPWYSIFSQIGSYIASEGICIEPSQAQIISYMFPNFLPLGVNKLEDSDTIDTTRFKLATDAIIKMFEKIAIKRKIILVIDDIQWMDEMSKILTNNILSSIRSNKLVLLSAYRDDYESQISNFTVSLISKALATEIKLKRFTYEETNAIISSLTPELSDNNEMIQTIYNDTEGNALFLIELLKIVREKGYSRELSSKSVNIIKSRLLDLTKDELKMVNAISMYFDKVNLDGLQIIVNMSELDMFDTLEALESRHLIVETITDNNIFYSFSHQKIRDYIYNNQSLGKRQSLHRKIAKYYAYEYDKTKNPQLLSTLIYHFEGCMDDFNTLKYKVEYYKEFFTVYHETFPVISPDIADYNVNGSASDIEDKLIKAAEQMEGMNRDDDEFNTVSMELSFILGRFYIANGNYIDGLSYIKKSIALSTTLNNNQYLLDNYKQMIFYSIQVHNMVLMRNYLNKSLELLKDSENQVEKGTIFRLDGLYYIKIKRYEQAQELLDQSIDIFTKLSKTNSKYTLSVAACYNYLGQMHKYQEDYALAYDYFDKAIAICNKSNYSSGIGIFYSNAGQALYRMNKLNKAYEYINKSIEYFKKNNSLWGRDIAEIYASMIAIKQKENSLAVEHYQTATSICEKIANPTSLLLLEKLKVALNKNGVC